MINKKPIKIKIELTTTLQINKDLHKKLMILKKKNKLKSMNAVILYILKNQK